MKLKEKLFDIAFDIEMALIDLDPYIILRTILKRTRPILIRIHDRIGDAAFLPIKNTYNFLVKMLVKVQVKNERLFRQYTTNMISDSIMNGW